jgi:hypothetical protein
MTNAIKIILVILGVSAGYYLLKQQRRAKMQSYFYDLGFGDEIINRLTFKELDAVYVYLTEYTSKGKSVNPKSSLAELLREISIKYQIINFK